MVTLRFICAGILALPLASVAHAQAPDAGAPAADPAHVAAQIEALRRGELDADVDPSTLFTVELDADGRLLLAELDDAPSPSTGPVDDTGAAALRRARLAFLSMPAEERRALLEAHRERRRQAQAAERAQSERQRRIQRARERTGQLRAFLAAELDPATDPQSLVTVNLLDEGDLGADASRRLAFVGQAAPPPDGAAPQDESSADELERALHELDAVRAQYAALSAQERALLFEAHRQQAAEPAESPAAASLSEAEAAARDAAEERERALESSRAARTEALRAVEEERARLLGVKEAQARLSIEVAEEQRLAEADRERALAWARRVRELGARSLLDASRERDADQLYDELVLALVEVRSELRSVLRSIADDEDPVPVPEALASLPSHVETRDVEQLYAEVSARAQELQRTVETTRWDRAAALRDAMVRMNESRLTLMDELSGARRTSLRGFGPDGTRQAGRELQQIELEGRYHLLTLPRWGRAQLAELRSAPVPILFVLLQIALVLVAFRVWSRRADGVLEAVRAHYADKRPQSPATALGASVAWYAKQVRRPAELLIFFGAIVAVLGVGSVPGVTYLWLVVKWALIGGIVVELLNAIAARHGGSTEATAALRLRSLRVVGITVVLIGLVLSLTEASVGRGAIYNWAFNTCWLLAIPVLLLLIVWWRPTVLERARAKHDPNRVIRWVASNSTGVGSFPAAAVGAVYLLIDGLKRYALRQAARLAVMQGLLAYLFRREVERRAEGRSSAHYEPIAAARLQPLDPATPTSPVIEDIMKKEVDFVRSIVESHSNAVIAVVGERGLGKTTFVDRVLADLPTSEVLRIACRPGGIEVVLEQLAAAVQLPETADDAAIAAAIERLSPQVVVVDDAQRLVRPLIGGLRDVDRLLELARSVGGSTSWLFAIGAPAWQYLRRARGDRAAFDEIVSLRRWTDAEIGELVRRRADMAQLELRYDDLVVPREIDASGYGASLDDTERDYTRILWSYADGNPSVALHFLRESLGERDGDVYVRLFQTPSIADIEDLPSSMHFVLRSIIQLELASEADIVSCTNLHPADVAEALRASRSRKLVEHLEGRTRLSLHWYRAIVAILQRQHLLARST